MGCQWGCNKSKVGVLLQDEAVKKPHTIVLRLAATSSKLQSFETRLTNKMPKLRIGSQAGPQGCQMVVDGEGRSMSRICPPMAPTSTASGCLDRRTRTHRTHASGSSTATSSSSSYGPPMARNWATL